MEIEGGRAEAERGEFKQEEEEMAATTAALAQHSERISDESGEDHFH